MAQDPRTRLVSHQRLIAALEEHSTLEDVVADDTIGEIRLYRGVPQQPKLGVTVYPPDENGQCEVDIDSAHASLEAVCKNLGIRFEPAGQIRKTTQIGLATVTSEPHRPPSPGAVALSEGREVTFPEARPPADEHYVDSEPNPKPSAPA